MELWGTAISAGLSGIMGMLGGNAKADQMAAQEAAGVYKNTLSIARTRMMNEYKQRAYRRQVDRVRQQMVENFKAANSSWQTEQARLQEQFLGFSDKRQALIKQLMQAEGYAAATETYGRSADRAIALATAAQFGNSEARLALTEQSAIKQSARNMGKIGGQAYAADVRAHGSILEGPIPEMAETTYQGSGFNYGLNSALSISQGLISGAQMGLQIDQSFAGVKAPSGG